MLACKAPINSAPALARPAAVKATRAVRCACRASVEKNSASSETVLHASLLPVLVLGAANPIQQALTPPAQYFASLGLPEWLVHWGHPGNMAVVLLAMGGVATWQGWQIRLSSDPATIKAASDSHPKLAAGMALFFALGATGGMMSMIMQGKDIFSSTHAWTGLGGLTLLALQAMLPLFFEDDPNARGIHAYLGSAIMALFLVHAVLGLQLGLSI